MRRTILSIVSSVALLGMSSGMTFALNITVNGALGDLDASGDMGAGEAAVVQALANCWAARVTTNRNFTLNVAGGALTGGTIGQGAVSAVDGNGIPTTGGLTMDNDGSTTYFVDTTPTTSTEFTTDDPNSPWRLLGGPGQVDLYSVVIHETGHALAWLCGNSCGFNNPNYDALMNPAPGNFVASATCVAPFPVRGQAALAGCVHLQGNNYDVSLRGDGLGDAVNDLSHPGITGDLMLGFYTGSPRETQSIEDVDLFRVAYADTVNLPPLVNAGANILSECNTTGGSNVTLNGSGSTDADTGVLTFSWSCPAISLSSANTATPSGFFPLDSDVNCRLDLTDIAACPPDADFTRVRVQDTTRPAVTCPPDAIVECTGNNGIAKSDPQLTGFFAGASATDVCDATLFVGNDAPSFLPLSDTLVTFSSTDDSLNTGSCDALATVQDTQLPTIDVVLDRKRLWPPNHKLVTIRAQVTVDDVCDPNLTIELTSITSNEPDNGLGDGDTADDIQDATFGTADTEFRLRSERSGTGTGRIYTIVYTVSDGSGNESPATVLVTVPHDRRD